MTGWIALEGSIKLHQHDILHNSGKFPVLSTATGIGRIIMSVALIAFNALALAFNTILALGDVLFAHSRDQAAVKRMGQNLQVIGYNTIQILHGALDTVPVLGNIPYWIEARCRGEELVPLAEPMPV